MQQDHFAPLTRLAEEIESGVTNPKTELPHSVWKLLESQLGFLLRKKSPDGRSGTNIIDPEILSSSNRITICEVLKNTREVFMFEKDLRIHSRFDGNVFYFKSLNSASELQEAMNDLKEMYSLKQENILTSEIESDTREQPVLILNEIRDKDSVTISYKKSTSEYTFFRKKFEQKIEHIVFKGKEGMTLEEILENIRKVSQENKRQKIIDSLFNEQF